MSGRFNLKQHRSWTVFGSRSLGNTHERTQQLPYLHSTQAQPSWEFIIMFSLQWWDTLHNTEPETEDNKARLCITFPVCTWLRMGLYWWYSSISANHPQPNHFENRIIFKSPSAHSNQQYNFPFCWHGHIFFHPQSLGSVSVCSVGFPSANAIGSIINSHQHCFLLTLLQPRRELKLLQGNQDYHQKNTYLVSDTFIFFCYIKAENKHQIYINKIRLRNSMITSKDC